MALQAEAGLDPEGGGALVLSHTGEGHGPNSPSGLAHGDQYWGMHPGGTNFLFADQETSRFIKELVGFTIFQSLTRPKPVARFFPPTSFEQGTIQRNKNSRRAAKGANGGNKATNLNK